MHFVRDPRATDLDYSLEGTVALPFQPPALALATSPWWSGIGWARNVA